MNVLLLVGIAKLFSEQSTYLIGELRQDKKQRFNTAVAAVDNFMAAVERDLSQPNLKTLELLTESLNNGMHNLRNDLLNDTK